MRRYSSARTAGHDADSHAVGIGHIDGDEIDASLVRAKQEMSIPAQPVQLGDDQRGAIQLAGSQDLG
jgi:hypothetical protein